MEFLREGRKLREGVRVEPLLLAARNVRVPAHADALLGPHRDGVGGGHDAQPIARRGELRLERGEFDREGREVAADRAESRGHRLDEHRARAAKRVEQRGAGRQREALQERACDGRVQPRGVGMKGVREGGVALARADGERRGEPRAESLVADGLDNAADVDQGAFGVRAAHQRTMGGGRVAAVFHGPAYSALPGRVHITTRG